MLKQKTQRAPLSLTPLLLGLALLVPADAQFIQQGSKLVGNGLTGAVKPTEGVSIAISADGNTVVFNGIWDDKGTGGVWVFTRSHGVWTQQGSKLLGSGGSGIAVPLQGYSVAISGDGNTLLFGGPGDGGGTGAAWVFTRSGGVWTQQGPKLVGNGGRGQGASVALSADGNTALIGAPGDLFGAAWVFTRSGGVWTQQGKLVGSGAVDTPGQGYSVALSADGNTALVGGPRDSFGFGAVWVFTRSGGIWKQQGGKLVGTGAIGQPRQGNSVALSADGNTAVFGGPDDGHDSTGAFWVFTRGSGGVWTQQGSKLVGSGVSGFIRVGQSVALSSDGNTALAGSEADDNGTGSAWVFKRIGGTWVQNGRKLVGSGAIGKSAQGVSVALSGEGTALVAGYTDNYGIGAVWVFTSPRDPLMYDPSTGTSYRTLSNGDGTFEYVYNLFTPAFDVLRHGNFSGNGKTADLVLYNSHSGLGYIGIGNLDGTYDFNSLFWSPGYDIVESGDVNGDLLTDFVIYNSSTGAMSTGISDGAGGFTTQDTSVDPGYTLVRLADFTGDGNDDLLLYNRNTGAASLGIGDGTGAFTFQPLTVGVGYDIADSGDLDGDGKVDLILYNSASGNAVTGISDGVGGFMFTPLSLGPGFTSARLADFTGDGNADVLVYNRTTGAGAFGTGTGTGAFDFAPLSWSPGYEVVQAEDVNVDGKADIVLYNKATGTSYTGISDGMGGFAFTYSFWGPGKVFAR